MTTTKSNTSRNAMLTLFIVGAIAFACQSESAPGLALVPGQEVIDDPCVYYPEAQIRTLTITRRSEDGVDHYQQVSRLTSEGDVHGTTYLVAEDLRGETYVIDWIIYEREQSEPGVWTDWEVRELTIPFGYGGSRPPLPDESLYGDKTYICGEEVTDSGRFIGGAVLDGIEVRHFEVVRAEADLWPGQVSYVAEFWVDHSGRLHKRLVSDVSEDYIDETITRITNHGDDIVIEPPDMGGQ